MGPRVQGGLATSAAVALTRRYAEASPLDFLPFGVPQKLFVGTLNNSWRGSTNISYTAAAKAASDTASLEILNGANHFDNADPDGPAWAEESDAAFSLLHVTPGADGLEVRPLRISPAMCIGCFRGRGSGAGVQKFQT